MAESYRCPQCGAEVPKDAPQGLCPNCVLKAGFGTQQTDSVLPTGSESVSASSFDAQYVPPTPAELAPHFPDLEIMELVGRGGMGVVYKARQKRLDRLVALKILAPKIGQDPAFAERFAREARAMAMLSHPHVVAVHDFGQTDGLYYFLMEFVDGVNLRRLLDTGKLAPEEALAIVPQICEALQYAHDHGVVHRDIKPENLLLDKEGRVKIADFGIAKLVGKDAKDLTLTGAGQIIGTPQYMAPEQIEHPLQVDHRADIYSLGVVFYQMLTGELPIGRFAPPSKKVQIDVRLDEVVLRALEKEPEYRYQQASEIKTQVESIVSTPDASGEAALKSSVCYISTPEHLRSFRGRSLYIYKGKGELRLGPESLSFHSDWPTIAIPLSSIRRIAQGDYPYTAKPVPIHFIEVTFSENGEDRTLLFTPLQREIMMPCDANAVAADWLSALIEAVRVATGRTLPIEKSHIPQDKLWLVKSILLASLQCGVIYTAIPAIMFRQVPSLWLMLVGSAIPALTMALMFLVMRWRHRRSVAASGSLDSLTMRVAGNVDRTGNLAVGTTSDKPTWQSPNAGWGWLIGKMFGITFTSRTAYRCANLSALGFLGFLGFVPNSGWQGCFGFFGIFGLIGVAYVIEAFARPNLTTGKWLVMVTAIALAVGVFVSLFLTYWNATPPRQQWQAATKLSGPGIDRVLIEGRQATIEGEASADSRIMFTLGGGYESCGFKKNGRFTATVKAAFWRNGLDIEVVDTEGNRLLTAWINGLGSAQFPPYHVQFENTPVKPEADGRIPIGYAVKDDGVRLPFTVQLSSRRPGTPVHRNAVTIEQESAGKAKQLTEPVLQFGSVVERVVNAVGEGSGGGGIDLTSGKLVDMPKDFSDWSAQQQNKWSAENGVDFVVALVTGIAVGAPDNKSLALVSEGLKLAAIWDGRWENATNENLRLALSSADPTQAVSPEGMLSVGVTVSERLGITYYVPFNSGPLTFVFETRKGIIGLLQLIRFTEQPRGMRIRYKLVQSLPQRETAIPDRSSNGWAKAMFDKTFHDFGNVTRDSKAETRFVIENIYDEEVHVLSAVSDFAACFPVQLTTQTLKTWEKTELSVSMDTHQFVGKRSGKIRVDFDRPFRGHVELQVTGYIGDKTSAAKTDSNSQKAGEQASSDIAHLPLPVPMPLPPTQDAWSLLTLEQGPLQLSIPTGWTIEYRRNGSSDFYSASPGFLAFFGPALSKPEDISAKVRELADELAKGGSPQDKERMSSNYTLDSFVGDGSKGIYAVFQLHNVDVPMVLAVFMVNVEGQIWQGQFSGTVEYWKQALGLLKTVRRKTDGTHPTSLSPPQTKRSEAPGKPTSDAATRTDNNSQKAGEKAPFEFSVIVAQHVMLLDGKQIVTWPQIEEMVAKRPNPSQTRPSFRFTLGANRTDRYEPAKKEMWRLDQKYKFIGFIDGGVTPQDSYRYDRIRTADDLKADRPHVTPGMTSLAEAVGLFNYLAQWDATGKTQPPLTEDEVIAAIRWALLEPRKLPISDATLQALGKIAESRELPSEFELEVISGFQPNNQMEVTRWSVRLRIPSTAGPGHTTCISIREQPIRSRLIGDDERKVIEKWQKKWQTEGMPLGDLRRGGEYEKERAKAAEIDRSNRDTARRSNGKDSDSGGEATQSQNDQKGVGTPSTSVFLGGYQITDADVKHLEGQQDSLVESCERQRDRPTPPSHFGRDKSK